MTLPLNAGTVLHILVLRVRQVRRVKKTHQTHRYPWVLSVRVNNDSNTTCKYQLRYISKEKYFRVIF